MITSSFKLFLTSSSFSDTSSEDCISQVEKAGGCQSGGSEGTNQVVGRQVLFRWKGRGWGALRLSASREWAGRLDPFPVHYTYLLYKGCALCDINIYSLTL